MARNTLKYPHSLKVNKFDLSSELCLAKSFVSNSFVWGNAFTSSCVCLSSLHACQDFFLLPEKREGRRERENEGEEESRRGEKEREGERGFTWLHEHHLQCMIFWWGYSWAWHIPEMKRDKTKSNTMVADGTSKEHLLACQHEAQSSLPFCLSLILVRIF